MLPSPVFAKFDVGLIIKLTIYSLIVGAVLYWLRLSPGEIYGYIVNKIAGVWNWLMGTGIEYILLGASIVVPVYLLMHFKDRMKNRS